METLFFDLLMTSMEAVIQILSCSNIDTILYHDNIVKDMINPMCGDNSRINIKSLNYCVSIHDLGVIFDDNDIQEFINKYKRRFYRLIEYIKSNEKLCFIRHGFVTDDEKNTIY